MEELVRVMRIRRGRMEGWVEKEQRDGPDCSRSAQFVGTRRRGSEFLDLFHLLPHGFSNNSGFRSSEALLFTIEMA